MVDVGGGEVGHCKDREHVRVRVAWSDGAVDETVWRAVFVAETSCVNVPGYDGWVVQLLRHDPRAGWVDSLRLLPELADVLPAWLRRARRQAVVDDDAVSVEHTFDKQWKVLMVLTPAAAKALARSVQRAAAQGPMDGDA